MCDMNPSNTNARIAALRRYISMLHLEEKRLRWLLASTSTPGSARVDDERDVRSISEKLRKAEKELSDLELKR